MELADSKLKETDFVLARPRLTQCIHVLVILTDSGDAVLRKSPRNSSKLLWVGSGNDIVIVVPVTGHADVYVKHIR